MRNPDPSSRWWWSKRWPLGPSTRVPAGGRKAIDLGPNARPRSGVGAGIALEEFVELGNLEANVGDGRLDLRLPVAEGAIELGGGFLQRLEANIAILLRLREIFEALIEDGVVVGETLGDLISDLHTHELHRIVE